MIGNPQKPAQVPKQSDFFFFTSFSFFYHPDAFSCQFYKFQRKPPWENRVHLEDFSFLGKDN